MSVYILTQSRQNTEEIVEFSNTLGAAGQVVAGEWVKPDGLYNKYTKMGAGEVDAGAKLVVLQSDRPDTGGTPISGNPGFTFTGIVSNITILRNTDNQLIITDQLTGTPALGAELTVKGGVLIVRGVTEPLFGYYKGEESGVNVPHRFVTEGNITGHVVELVTPQVAGLA